MLGNQPIRRRGRDAEPLAFTASRGHAEAFLTPEPLDGLAVDRPAGLAELGVGATVAPAGMHAAELAQLGSQCPVPVGLDRLVALGGAVLPDQPARPPLGHAEHLLQVVDGAAPAGRAHQFPRPSSFKASILLGGVAASLHRVLLPVGRSDSQTRWTNLTGSGHLSRRIIPLTMGR
jgi:hypothetical protein